MVENWKDLQVKATVEQKMLQISDAEALEPAELNSNSHQWGLLQVQVLPQA
jgi:hypothetical protein